jgi:hypothetical protein
LKKSSFLTLFINVILISIYRNYRKIFHQLLLYRYLSQVWHMLIESTKILEKSSISNNNHNNCSILVWIGRRKFVHRIVYVRFSEQVSYGSTIKFFLIKAVHRWTRWFFIKKWENLTSMRNGLRTYSKMSITILMPIWHTTDPCVDTKIIQVLEKRNISLFQDFDGFVRFCVNICVGRVAYRHGSLSEKPIYLKKIEKYNPGMHWHDPMLLIMTMVYMRKEKD